MINAFYTASLGLISQQYNMDVLANNIANINTPGYKGQRATFVDLLYNNIPSANGTTSRGSGTYIVSTDTVFTQGYPEQTDRKLDVAIKGEGFFAVRSSDGSTYYTRDGNFQMQLQSDGQYALTNSSGDYVLDNKFKPIIISDPGSDLKYSLDPNNPDSLNPGIFSFKNVDAMTRAENNCYLANAQSGDPSLMANAVIMQGYIESSAVDIADEMSKVIIAQRAFQFNAKLIQIADEIEQMTNNMKG